MNDNHILYRNFNSKMQAFNTFFLKFQLQMSIQVACLELGNQGE
jgi:hypothetical protein